MTMPNLPIVPSDAVEEYPVFTPAPRVRHLPHMGHALLFVAIAAALLLAVQGSAMGLARALHWFPHHTYAELAKDPMMVVVTEALAYLLTLGLAATVFPMLWQRSFSEGLQWNAAAVRWPLRLIGLGFALAIISSTLEQVLPMPKNPPIEDFFQGRAGVWMITAFGTLLAPVFEEICFRGFLLPAFAIAWDWVSGEWNQEKRLRWESSTGYSRAALIFAAIVTSIGFACLHAEQLAHAWGPIAVLFCVSIVLTVVRVRMRSVAASALVHAGYNFFLFAVMFVGTGGYRHLDKLKG